MTLFLSIINLFRNVTIVNLSRVDIILMGMPILFWFRRMFLRVQIC